MNVNEVSDLLAEFWQSASDACLLEEKQQAKQEKLFKQFVEIKLAQNSFADSASFLMKHMAENYHPHMMAVVESDNAVLWEGKSSHIDSQFVVD